MTDPIKRGGGSGPVDPSGGGAGPEGASGPRTEGFREALGPHDVRGAGEAAGPAAGQVEGAVSDLNHLATQLRAGQLSPEQVVEALVARQLRSHAAQMLTPTQRADLESVLRSRLAEDPTLLALGRDLSRSR